MDIIGNVRDSKETIVGANVYESDKNGKILSKANGTVTDVNGNYTLKGVSVSNPKYITVSFIGYKSVTKPVADLQNVGLGVLNTITAENNVVLVPDTAQIPEFTVIADPVSKVLTKARNNKWMIIAGVSLLIIILIYVFRKKLRIVL